MNNGEHGHRRARHDEALRRSHRRRSRRSAGRAGEICGFLGPNGSGKTTFIRMLCGLLRADDGSGTCLGYDVITESEAIKRQVGYMTQRFSFWEDLSIEENLDFVARMYGVQNRRQAVQRKPRAARAGGSRGTTRRPTVRRLEAAARTRRVSDSQPKLLLLDEPTAGVDPKARRDFWEQIHQLAGQGPDLSHHHALHGRGRALPPARLHLLRQTARRTARSTKSSSTSALTTWSVSGPDLLRLGRRTSRNCPACNRRWPLAMRCTSAATTRPRSSRRSRRFATTPYEWQQIRSGLEDVFIHLMDESQDNFAP